MVLSIFKPLVVFSGWDWEIFRVRFARELLRTNVVCPVKTIDPTGSQQRGYPLYLLMGEKVRELSGACCANAGQGLPIAGRPAGQRLLVLVPWHLSWRRYAQPFAPLSERSVAAYVETAL